MALTIGKLGAALALSALLNGAALAQLAVASGATVNMPLSGTLGMGCNALDVQGLFNVNAGQVSNASNVGIGGSGTLNGGSGTITLGGNWSNSGTFTPGNGSVVISDTCAVGQSQITGTTVFNNLTLTSTSGRTFVLPAGANITVNGTLTLQGTANNPIQLMSSSGKTAVVSLGPQAQVIRNFATVPGTVQIGASTPPQPQSIPTLSEFSMMILSLLLAAIALGRGHLGLAGNKRK